MMRNRVVGEEIAVRGWATEGSSTTARTEVQPEALREAAAIVARRIAAEPISGLGSTEAGECLGALVDAIVCSDLRHLSSIRSPAAGQRLLELIRSELVRLWENDKGACGAAQMVAALAAIERVAAALQQRSDNPGAMVPTGLDFVAGVAHDLRSPLTSILFLAETLHSEQSGEINDLQRRQLGIIYSAALGLVSVASDIIELARGGEGLNERRPILFSITEVLESVNDIVRPMAEEKGLRVQLFPPAVDQRMGYPLALSRVLLNLTTNGLKFTDSGFVEISCRATASTRVEFSVRDTGKGYTPDAIDSLYQPFRRSRDGKKYGFSGTGLGLAISQKLVAAMGSTLEVETRPRWGTRFYFELELPAAPAP